MDVRCQETRIFKRKLCIKHFCDWRSNKVFKGQVTSQSIYSARPTATKFLLIRIKRQSIHSARPTTTQYIFVQVTR